MKKIVKAQFLMYPIPALDNVYWFFDALENLNSVEMINTIGQKFSIQSKLVLGKLEFNLNNVKAGIYQMIGKDIQGNAIATAKLIKE